jgi:hypothetical protein
MVEPAPETACNVSQMNVYVLADRVTENCGETHSLGQVYRFLLSALDNDEDIAKSEFRKFVAGELSERLLELARQWVSQEQSASHESNETIQDKASARRSASGTPA